jgi:hypothetical protein
MPHLNKLIFALFLFPLFSMAQSNYKPGYVVTLKGDTLHGFVDYREWDKNPKNISFKNINIYGKAENFTTKNTLAFAITGLEYYERYVVSVSLDATDINKLSTEPDTSYLTDTVFLRISTKGKYLKLYSYTDNIKLRFYLLETGQSQPQELIYHAFYNPNVSRSAQYITRYRTQLENLAQKYNVNTDAVKRRILQTDYNESEFIKIVQAINGYSSVQFTPQSTSSIRWFAGISVNYSNLNFNYNNTDLSNNSIGLSGKYGSFFPKITAGLDFYNKNAQSIVLRADYSFTASKYNVSSQTYSSLGPVTNTVHFSQYSSAITPQIIFNIYNAENLKVFVGAGVSLNLSTYSNHQYVQTYSTFTPFVMNNFPDFSQFWVSFPIKAGIVVNKKMEINVCYIPPSVISNYSTFSGFVSSYQAGVNYFFGK